MTEYTEKYLELARQTAAYRELSAAFASDSGNCSYLLASPDTLLSECVALLVACGDGDCGACLECPKCRRIISGRCADVKLIRDGFMTEDADDVVAGCGITPSELKRKYYILNLTKTNEAAQNKLLKTLEEVPECSVFFVIVPSKSALLPTVASRLEEISPFLPSGAKLPTEGEYLDLALYGGRGNLTEYDGLISGDKAYALENAIEFVKAIGEDKQLLAASLIPQKRDEAAEVLKYIEMILGDIMKANSGISVDTRGLYDMKRMADKYPLGALPESLSAVRRAAARAAGGKLTSVADALVITISEVRKCLK